MRIFLIVVAVLAVLSFAGYFAWYRITGPMYQPGMVRAGKNLRASLDPPPQIGQAGFWQVEPDVRLHYFSSGRGEPVLVIHGGPGHPATKPWTGLDLLADRHRFYYYDLRGAGESTRLFDRFSSSNTWGNMQTLDRGYGMGAQVADVERIRRILGPDKLTLVGHSFGGLIAALYAAEFPEHVQRLVLISPAGVLVMPPADGGLFALIRQRLPESRRPEFDAFLKEYLDFRGLFAKDEAAAIALNDRMDGYYMAAYPNPAIMKGGHVGQTRPGGWMVFGAYLSMGRHHDYLDAMKSTSFPVEILHGADDVQPEKDSRTYLEIYPQASFEAIVGAGHFAFEEQPEEFATRIRNFLEGR